MAGVLVAIKEALGTLKPAEQRVAELILRQPETVVNYTIRRLAEEGDTSIATVARLCKELNLQGYQELKLRIAEDLGRQVVPGDAYQEIRPDGDVQTLIQSVSLNNVQSIHDTMQVLDSSEVEKAIAALSGARRIDFYGVGASALIARDAMQKFLRIGKTCLTFDDTHMQATAAVSLTEDDVVVGVSYSGETKEVIHVMQLAKDAGATVISITKFGANSVAELADIKLCTSSLEKSIRSGAMASRIAQLNVVDILFIGVASLQAQTAYDYLERTRDAVQGRLKK